MTFAILWWNQWLLLVALMSAVTPGLSGQGALRGAHERPRVENFAALPAGPAPAAPAVPALRRLAADPAQPVSVHDAAAKALKEIGPGVSL